MPTPQPSPVPSPQPSPIPTPAPTGAPTHFVCGLLNIEISCGANLTTTLGRAAELGFEMKKRHNRPINHAGANPGREGDALYPYGYQGHYTGHGDVARDRRSGHWLLDDDDGGHWIKGE